MFSLKQETRPYEVIPPDVLLEEQSLLTWKHDRYYPAHIGEVLDGRYRIIGKLGFGTLSTVWLCKRVTHLRAAPSDQPPTVSEDSPSDQEYLVAKILTRDASTGMMRSERSELKMLEHLSSVKSDHPGRRAIRKLVGTFTLKGAKDGELHTCLLHQPLDCSLATLQYFLRGALDLDLVKSSFLRLLLALDYLHTQANLVHTDLQAGNILLEITDRSGLEQYEERERASPSARKVVGDYTVYASREIPTYLPHVGSPVLVDFGEARDGRVKHRDEIMPDVYRAPEVVLDAPWDYKVDVWNLGVLMWTLLQGDSLFRGIDPEGKLSNYYHLAEMLALLGPAPVTFVMKGEFGPQYFNEDGTWKPPLDLPKTSLEDRLTRLHGEEKKEVICVLRKLLQWDPAERPTILDLAEDDFFMSHLRS